MKKRRAVLQIAVIVAVIVLCGFTTLVGFSKQHKGSAQNIKLGLDLAGGVSITYEAVGDTPSSTDMEDTRNMLQKRAEVYSTESSVVIVGNNRITVDIPGVADAEEVLASLGKEGSLDFVAADEMSTDDDGNPVYTETICTGKEVVSAEAATQTDSVTKNREYVVELKFNTKGTKKFAAATEAAYPNRDQIYIVYDGEILSAPAVQAEITNGEAVISGSFSTYEEAEELASMIRIGALPVELREVQSQVVGAQLGLNAIQTSLIAGLIGFLIIIIFMIAFYRLAGVAASIALILYLGLMMVALNGLNVTLTLSGIAGIILNIGMAVDANVIIFTRIREELAKGKTVQSAIRIGFDKALSAILDGNITTLIAALVLYIVGSGTVRGFATTLGIGIILSMFTALVITRILLKSMYALGADDVKFYGTERQRKTIPFVKHRAKFFAVSGALILACVVCLVVNKAGRCDGNILNYGLDFSGGTTYDITFNDDQVIDDSMKLDIEDLFMKEGGSNDVVISEVAGENALSVKTGILSEEQRNAVTNALLENYSVEEENIQNQNVSSSVSDEMRRNAILAVIIAAVCMLIYIWIRFRDVVFAGSAIIALIHDVLVVLLVYALVKISVGNTFIACMLTIVGYSINATIVIFDRIRENLGKNPALEDYTRVVNESVTQTLTRSINTSLTTFIMVLMIAILGVESIRDFAIPLLVGIVCGAYSSVCITGSLWYTVKKWQLKRKGMLPKKEKRKENGVPVSNK